VCYRCNSSPTYRGGGLLALFDKIYLSGTAGADGKYVGVSSAAAGNTISFASFKADSSSYDWIAVPISGNWTAEA